MTKIVFCEMFSCEDRPGKLPKCRWKATRQSLSYVPGWVSLSMFVAPRSTWLRKDKRGELISGEKSLSAYEIPWKTLRFGRPHRWKALSGAFGKSVSRTKSFKEIIKMHFKIQMKRGLEFYRNYGEILFQSSVGNRLRDAVPRNQRLL